MKSIDIIMHEAFNVVIFCLALSLLFWGMKNLNDLHTTTLKDINSSNVLYEQYQEIPDKNQISYYEMIAIMLSGLENDIVVNGLEIKAIEYDYLQFDYSLIEKTNYIKEYIADTNGYVVKVVYNSI